MNKTIVMAQTRSTNRIEDNLQKGAQFVERACAEYRADMVLFPEYFMYYYPPNAKREDILSSAQPLDGDAVRRMQCLARERGIWLGFGINEVSDNGDERMYNTMVLLDDKGEIVLSYRKSHLYDADNFKESNHYQPGQTLCRPFDSPFGKMAMMICYEIRFPEIARKLTLEGAEVILAPAAWVRADLKPMHWKVQLATRAIENGVYIIAPNHYSPKVFLGESIAVDPMGIVTANGNEAEDLVPCTIDLGRVTLARKKFPNFENRRPELY